MASGKSKPSGKEIPINPALVWDYDLPAEGERTEAFYRWYVGRVLTRGRAEDLKAIGFETILGYLPNLELPDEIRRFWEWYFDLPAARQRNERSHAATS